MKKRFWLVALLVLAAIYCGGWFYVARLIGQEIDRLYAQAADAGIAIEGARPAIGGFPGPHSVSFSGRIHDADGRGAEFPLLKISGIFLPGMLVHIEAPKGAAALGSYDRDIWSLDRADIVARIPKTLPGALYHADMKAWHDAGGGLEVKSFDLAKRGLDATGGGALTLDDDLQPQGNLAVGIAGDYVGFLAFLRGKGVIRQKEALLSAAILTGMSHKNPDTGENEISAAFRLQDRTLYLGMLRLTELPRAEWPQ
jgi:hypothetical protein